MMSRPTYPTNSFQQLGMALAGLLLAGSATSASTGQPELMCGDHDPQHNTCSSILQVTREGEQLQFVLYLLLPGSTDQEQPVKVVLQAAALLGLDAARVTDVTGLVAAIRDQGRLAEGVA